MRRLPPQRSLTTSTISSAHSFAFSATRLPEAKKYQERARPNRRRQAVQTISATVGIGGLAFLMWKLSATTLAPLSRQEIQGVLHTYLAGPPLDSAVHALTVAGSRPNDRLPWILLAVGAWLFGMLVIWLRGYAFPDSLLLGEVEKEAR